ncbi:MAG: 4-hydroxythreonine-4-phosphate dehydrogenase PdxA [Chitinivibrionales bacterium]
MKNSLPLLAITMGDPAGIGPEIAVRACSRLSAHQLSRILIIGELTILKRWRDDLCAKLDINPISAVDQMSRDAINILSLDMIGPSEFAVGKVSAACGKASFEYIITAIELAMQKKIQGVVTCPINKESLHQAGITFPGHTEIFAQYTHTDDYTMMFLLDDVSVVHVTTHCSLLRALELIRAPRVLKNITLLDRALRSMGLSSPRIAVGGVNPHAGENGLFGREEIDHVIPAMEQARAAGIDVTGPYPPDTVFMRAFRGEFDGVVSMLHDHGFVALKSRDFERGVNITIGLPIVRTSVGHGTAFDIAGQGRASPQSLLEAIRVGRLLASPPLPGQ